MGERLTEAQRKFLHRLVVAGGVAHPREIGPQTSQEMNSARQRCKRRGWVKFALGHWCITDAGRSLLKENPNG